MRALLVAGGGAGASAAGELAALAAAARLVVPTGSITAVCDPGCEAAAAGALGGLAPIVPPGPTAGTVCAALLAADRIDDEEDLLVLAAGGLAAGGVPLVPEALAAWLRALPAPGRAATVAHCGGRVLDLAWFARGALLLEAGEACLLAGQGNGGPVGLAAVVAGLESTGAPVARVQPGPTAFRLDDMVRGWFVGPFAPTAVHAAGCEVAVKRFVAGEREALHHHRAATEVTLLLEGRARMGERLLGPGDGLVLPPGTASDFEALSPVLLVAVKVPGVPDDKVAGAPPPADRAP